MTATDIIYLTQTQFNTLVNGGSITYQGEVLTYDEAAVYCVEEDLYNKAQIDSTFQPKTSNSLTTTSKTVVGAINENKGNIDDIEALIPAQATSSNQLGDKDFINSSIATNTAYYISNNGQPFNSVAELEAYTGTVTNNDYAFVTGVDEQGNTYYDRYKATVIGSTITWAKEFRLNNSSFTAVQWSAITSGITSALVSSYNSHIANTSNPHGVTYQQLGGTKPTYTYTEVGAEPSGAVSTHNSDTTAHSSMLSAKNIADVTNETWNFVLSDGTTVTKTMKVGA